jgi:hypothetical protein
MGNRKTEETKNNSFEGNALSEGDVRKLVQARNRLVKNLKKQGIRKYTFEECYTSSAERLKEQDEGELIEAFNKQVGVNAWVLARGAYLFALRDEFESRGIDCSVIGDKRNVCTAKRVKLDGKRLTLEKGGKNV